MSTYKCIIIDGPDYDTCLNHVLLQQAKGLLEIVGVLTKFKNIKTIDGYPAVHFFDLQKINYDYAILMSLDDASSCINDLKKYCKIPSDKIIGISPFREPNFNFSEYIELKQSEVTIIADNCFGGYLYNFFSLPFNSPFINMYLSKEDMLKMMRNPKQFLSSELTFSHTQKDDSFDSFPVCKLNDMMLFMNHYHDFEEAKYYWDKRTKRINYDNMIFVLHFRNECPEFYEVLELNGKKIINIAFEPSKKIANNPDNIINYVFEFNSESLCYDENYSLMHNAIAHYNCPFSQSILLSKALLGKESKRKTIVGANETDFEIQMGLKSLGKQKYIVYQQMLDDVTNPIYEEIISDKKFVMTPELAHANAMAYLTGRVVKKDYQKAAFWMRKAYEQKYWSSSWELFDILWQIGTPESLQEMISMALKEAESGQRDMQCRLARAYAKGYGINLDLEKAAFWMRKAYELGLNDAKQELDNILATNNNTMSSK